MATPDLAPPLPLRRHLSAAGLADAGPPAAAALALAHSLRGGTTVWPLVVAVVLLALAKRHAPRGLTLVAALAVAVQVAAVVHARLEPGLWSRWAQARVEARLAAVEDRAGAMIARLQSEADAAAALPETRAALGGDRAALVRLFDALRARSHGDDGFPALAIHALPLTTIAWSGRHGDPAVFEGLAGTRKEAFILGGTVTTTLVASSPVTAPDGRRLGVATASLPIAVHRNLRNEFLADYDLLAGDEGGVDFRYVDARGEEGPRPFPPPTPGTFFNDGILRAPQGRVLAAVRAIAPPPEEERNRLDARYRFALVLLTVLALMMWPAHAEATGGRLRLARWAAALLAVRAVLLALGPPFPPRSYELLSPDTYASPLLGPLLKSPLDLLLTSATALGLAILLLASIRPPGRPYALRLLLAIAAAIPILGGTFVLLADTVANCALDLSLMPLVPQSLAHLVVQVALLAVLATGGLLITSVAALGGPPPATPALRAVLAAGLLVLGLAAWFVWPRPGADLPVAPALLLFGSAVAAGAHWTTLRGRLQASTAGTRASATLVALGSLAALLYPSLVHFGQKGLHTQIEGSYAPLILRQPEWRAFVLQTTESRIDEMNLLEDAPPGLFHPGIDQLAFAVWSATDLAGYGFSSAVEIQDPGGNVISRFALNLPSISAPARRLPRGEEWAVSREPVGLASAETMVLHAQRVLAYHGEPHGAVHVYVGEDFWSLPFVQGRDPYSILYRNAARGGLTERPVSLLVYDSHHDVVFSSLERPPALDPALAARAEATSRQGAGFWTQLEVDEVDQHAYLFASDHLIYGLAYRRLAPGRYLADLVEAVSGTTLLAAGALVLVVLVRSLLRRPTLSLGSITGAVGARFALRLFVAFTLVAFVPAAVLQIVVSGFVVSRLRRESEDQALERAAVAKKAVEDYAFFQREEAQGADPVSDAALVWLASVVKNDLDLFVKGRLQASSKRELYASGLLAPRVAGSVYSAIVLEAQPATVETERIGGFSYLVASVPVHLGGPERAILSMPLALRQREAASTVSDLDRTIRLASVAFLALAAALAHSMSRRISEPIHDLTSATRRIAQGDLEARVQARSQDELRRLVESFNQMAGDLERQRRDLERSNRLAAWAEMARQVAHEVKNPLTPIQLSAEHLRRVWTDGSTDFGATLQACTETILEQVRTLRGMVTEFSAFARPPAPALEAHDPREIVEEVVRPYGTGLPPEVRLSLDLDGGVPLVRVDRRLLERAIVNLVENALQAVGEAGAIRISLRAVDAEKRIEVEVMDTGPGIPPEVRERIFEPFFSTKTTGSGLGLALVKKIAEDHGGGVVLSSAPGEPTRAILWLPAALPPEQPLTPAP